SAYRRSASRCCSVGCSCFRSGGSGPATRCSHPAALPAHWSASATRARPSASSFSDKSRAFLRVVSTRDRVAGRLTRHLGGSMRSSVMTLTLGAAGVVLLAACGGSTSPYGGGGGGTSTATKIWTVGGSQFNPTSLTVTAGTTVTWQNGDGVPHTVTSATGSADTYDMALAAGTVSHQFITAGTYNFYCKNHGVNG